MNAFLKRDKIKISIKSDYNELINR